MRREGSFVREPIMPWGELQWSEAELLEELAFTRWCEESCWPQAVSIWIRLVGMRHET
jgi:hypothetical protein